MVLHTGYVTFSTGSGVEPFPWGSTKVSSLFPSPVGMTVTVPAMTVVMDEQNAGSEFSMISVVPPGAVIVLPFSNVATQGSQFAAIVFEIANAFAEHRAPALGRGRAELVARTGDGVVRTDAQAGEGRRAVECRHAVGIRHPLDRSGEDSAGRVRADRHRHRDALDADAAGSRDLHGRCRRDVQVVLGERRLLHERDGGRQR